MVIFNLFPYISLKCGCKGSLTPSSDLLKVTIFIHALIFYLAFNMTDLPVLKKMLTA